MAHTENQAHRGPVTLGVIALPGRLHIQHEALRRVLDEVGQRVIDTATDSPGKRIFDILRIDIHAQTGGEIRDEVTEMPGTILQIHREKRNGIEEPFRGESIP